MRNLTKRRDETPSSVAPTGDYPFPAIQDQMSRLFEDVFGGFGSELDIFRPFRAFDRPWGVNPNLDVSETDNEIIVQAELPGLEEKDVEVTLENDILTLKGPKGEEQKDGERNYYLVERSYGAFQRSVQLPVGLDRDNVKAVFKNGVLTVTLPKTAEAKSERKVIDIQT